MSVDVAAEVVIDRPRGEVAAYAFDPANDPEWIGGIRTARALRPGPIAVGAQVERVARFLGRGIEYVNEVVELEPGTRLRMRSVRSPFPMDVAYELQDAGTSGATRMRIRVAGGPTRLRRLAGPLLGAAVRRSIGGDLRRLKGILEARPTD